MKSPFVICGATGNVGSRIAETLLTAGEPVRAIGRERVRLGPLAAKGAEPWPGRVRHDPPQIRRPRLPGISDPNR
jgi:uncharacterized protein YbjT (DUF2867 family)